MRYQEVDRYKILEDAQEISVIGPLGQRMTRHDLPASGTQRWVVRRKAEVVAGVCGGLISLKEACQRYNLSEDEFKAWHELFQNHGLTGLRATGLKRYRNHSRLSD